MNDRGWGRIALDGPGSVDLTLLFIEFSRELPLQIISPYIILASTTDARHCLKEIEEWIVNYVVSCNFYRMVKHNILWYVRVGFIQWSNYHNWREYVWNICQTHFVVHATRNVFFTCTVKLFPGYIQHTTYFCQTNLVTRRSTALCVKYKSSIYWLLRTSHHKDHFWENQDCGWEKMILICLL